MGTKMSTEMTSESEYRYATYKSREEAMTSHTRTFSASEVLSSSSRKGGSVDGTYEAKNHPMVTCFSEKRLFEAMNEKTTTILVTPVKSALKILAETEIDESQLVSLCILDLDVEPYLRAQSPVVIKPSDAFKTEEVFQLDNPNAIKMFEEQVLSSNEASESTSLRSDPSFSLQLETIGSILISFDGSGLQYSALGDSGSVYKVGRLITPSCISKETLSSEYLNKLVGYEDHIRILQDKVATLEAQLNNATRVPIGVFGENNFDHTESKLCIPSRKNSDKKAAAQGKKLVTQPVTGKSSVLKKGPSRVCATHHYAHCTKCPDTLGAHLRRMQELKQRLDNKKQFSQKIKQFKGKNIR